MTLFQASVSGNHLNVNGYKNQYVLILDRENLRVYADTKCEFMACLLNEILSATIRNLKEGHMFEVRKLVIVLLIAAFLMIPFGSSTFAKATKYPPEPDPAVMMVDFFVARPIGFASLIIGTVSFAISSPFSALGDNVDQAYNLLIVDPAAYTFKRPLGGF